MRRKFIISLIFVPQLVMAQTGDNAGGSHTPVFLGAAIIAYFVIMLWYMRRKWMLLNKSTTTHP